ncbi:MAG: hypothetical protein DI537_57600 [Stutzerimonas stutzeri]|nr:MAG: hypothetical protein DI537_57600 [Stutzerimonas stutzeri]
MTTLLNGGLGCLASLALAMNGASAMTAPVTADPAPSAQSADLASNGRQPPRRNARPPARPGGGGGHAQRPGGGGGHAQRPTGRPPARGGSSTNINHNRNVNRNVNVNVNHGGGHYDDHHDHHDHWDDWDDHWHPVRTAATVAVTAAVVGSIVRSVPPNCSTVVVNGISYSQCGSTWYQPRYAGSSVEYVVVNPPR